MAVFLFDLDGTMYHGTKIIPAAKKLIEYLLQSKQRFYFLTNNASRTPQENTQHMLDIGYDGIRADMFFNSAMACVSFARKNYQGKRVMMIGQSGLANELIKQNFQIVKEGADLVIVGLNQSGDYQLYSLALQNLLSGAVLLATNGDRVLLSEKGIMIGNGSVVRLLEYASGQNAVFTGKPSPIILDEALLYWDLTKEEVILVGDNLETDILCGLNSSVRTVFVLGGVHDISDMERLKIKPDRIVKNLTELI